MGEVTISEVGFQSFHIIAFEASAEVLEALRCSCFQMMKMFVNIGW